MDFILSEEQEMLRKTARDFLAERCPKSLVREWQESDKGYSLELWQEMASLGWLGLVFPEEYGGNGMSFLELAVLLDEMGRACLPSPFFSTVVLGGLPILDIGSEEQKQAYLPRIAKGRLIFTLALTEPSARYDADAIMVTAAANEGEYIINGTKLFVSDAHVSDFVIVIAKTGLSGKSEDGITGFIVDTKSPGIGCTLLKTTAGDKLSKIDFNQVSVRREDILGKLNQGWGEVENILSRSAVAKCCEIVGSVQQVLEMTVDYARTRRQFGQPIGSFQSIQNHCANMAIDVESSRYITYRAAWMLAMNIPCRKEAAMAKAWTADAYLRAVSLSHQVHGAVAFTIDHDLNYHTRRIKAAEVSFGDTGFHLERVAQEIGLG
ncbi:acyl-CoA dehydrogenase family protein [Bacteroidota bacterium]